MSPDRSLARSRIRKRVAGKASPARHQDSGTSHGGGHWSNPSLKKVQIAIKMKRLRAHSLPGDGTVKAADEAGA